MLIVQPTSDFGDLLCEELASSIRGQRIWQTFEFAVAWVNLPGAKRVISSAQDFLADGGRIRATVGLDFSSTSYEGLISLLNLEKEGIDITTHVFFDENQACTFHPKVFLFRNLKHAHLYVGSNNMTGAGLNTNIEVALGIKRAFDDKEILTARNTLAGWRDEATETRTKRLTLGFLDQLCEQGYVRTEKAIRDSRKTETKSKSNPSKPLFGRSETRTVKRDNESSGRVKSSDDTAKPNSEDILLMRVRPRRNGKQFQISMKLLQGFMRDAEEVVSAVEGTSKRIGYSKRTNKKNGERKNNTARFECPEMANMKNPVARFQWVDTEGNSKVLQYEVFDADSNDEGAQIFEKLKEGIATPPERGQELSREWTALSSLSIEKAQWYRLVSG